MKQQSTKYLIANTIFCQLYATDRIVDIFRKTFWKTRRLFKNP